MAVTILEFQDWIEEGEKMGATHLISVCDRFDYSDYPIYVMPSEDVSEKKKEYDDVNMQKINEIVKLGE